MKKIAVAGIGAIGGIVGGGLALAGRDVALICTSWRKNAEHMREHGLTVMGADEVERTARVEALFIDELSRLGAQIDLVLLTTKSNDTEGTLSALKPYLATDAVVVSLQNGMNEDLIIPLVGKENIVAGVSYTGGMLVRPGYVRAHGGRFVVGELDGSITPRVEELAAILAEVAPTDISRDILGQRWDKLAQVTMTVPIGAIAGIGFPAILEVEKAHPLMARLICETLAVAAAAGHPLAEVSRLTAADWRRLAGGPAPDLSRIISEPFRPRPGTPLPDPADAPFLKDLRLGLPLEIDHTNGYVIAKGRELGIPTPVHGCVLEIIKGIERGELEPGLGLVDEILVATEAAGR